MTLFRRRILYVYIILSILAGALIGRLIYIHTIWNDELTIEAKKVQDKSIVIPAKRGIIMDRNGEKLAFSIKTYSVWAEAKTIKKPNETADLIATALDIDSKPIVDKLLSAKSTFVKVVSNISKSESDLIRGMGISGISITEDTERMYPYNNLASHLIGNVNMDGDGFLGVELYFNDLLKGQSGLYDVTTDVYGRQLAYGESNLQAPIDGQNIMLTIDNSIQYFVEDRLEEAMIKHQPKSISAIVMNPKNGEIIAMASKPDFDLNNPRTHVGVEDAVWDKMTDEEKMNYWSEMWKNRVITNTYEPGSTFKSVVAAAALEEKIISLDSTFKCVGFKEVSGVILHCVSFPVGHGVETFVQAFVNSCNPTFIEVGQKLGVNRLYDYMEKFGLFQKTGIQLPAEASSISLPEEKIGPVELATLSYGHSVNLTMMQMARAVSALVNGGYLITPQIVKASTDEFGNVLENFQTPVAEQIISKATSDQLRFLFQSAVEHGGGKIAYIEGIKVGGKSGTSQKMTENGYDSSVVAVSFVGIAPMDDPEYLVFVMVDEPKDEFLGSLVAAPIVKDIMLDIFRYKNIVPDVKASKTITIPELKGKTLKEAQDILIGLGIESTTTPLEVEDTTLIVNNQYPAAGTQVDSNAIVILSVED